MRKTKTQFVRFKPHALALQTRFRWRHRDTDPWRRLMDCSCFPVDWIGRTRGPDLSQYGGHWTHVLTCAHCICPWDYPNFYPPAGQTKWVSRVTLPDTLTQIRVMSLQGEAIHKHFTSQHHVFVHRNPRLDLCVIHPEQNLKRCGEMKMLWMQNEGYIIRPRFEILNELKEGDFCWVYGMSAHNSLYDEEAPVDPYMIPTGVKTKVKHIDTEHFFLEPFPGEPEISMGMCGSAVMRDGKLVGMLTATVHETSENEKIRGTAMCTYARDIRDFLREVEKQMKNLPSYSVDRPEWMDAERQAQQAPQKSRDWIKEDSRLARHIPVPISLWKNDEMWTTEEDRVGHHVFSKGGFFNQEQQENLFNLDMNGSNADGKRPESMHADDEAGTKLCKIGERPDVYATRLGVHAPKEDWKDKSEWDTEKGMDMKEFIKGNIDKQADAETVDKLRRSVEYMQQAKAQQEVHDSVMKNSPSTSTYYNSENVEEEFQAQREAAAGGSPFAKTEYNEAEKEFLKNIQRKERKNKEREERKRFVEERIEREKAERERRKGQVRPWEPTEVLEGVWEKH